MENIVLKQEVLDKIKKDPILYGQVAESLGLQPISLFKVLRTENKKLTQAGIMKVLREYLDVQDSELLETILQEA